MQSIWILLGLVVLITARGYGDDDDRSHHKDNDDNRYGDKHDNKHQGDDDDNKHHGDDDDRHHRRGDKDDKRSGDDDDKHHGDNDDEKPVYKKKDDSCDFSKRDKYRVPEKLVPSDSELVLLVHGEGYRAFVWDAAGNLWLENGRQVKLNDPNTKKCVASISTDAKTVALDQTLQYQHSYFADGSFVIRDGLHTGETNPCDKHCAPWALYPIVEQSHYPGVLTGVTHVAVFDTHGGAAPTHKGKKDQQIHIEEERANYAFYRGAAPTVKPLPKGDDDDKHYGDDDDKHNRYGDDDDRHHRNGDDDDKHHGDDDDKRRGDDDDRHHRNRYGDDDDRRHRRGDDDKHKHHDDDDY